MPKAISGTETRFFFLICFSEMWTNRNFIFQRLNLRVEGVVMFIIIEKTTHGSVLQGQSETEQSLGLPAKPSRSGKAINAYVAERRQVEEHKRKMIKVLLRGSISFCSSGSPYFKRDLKKTQSPAECTASAVTFSTVNTHFMWPTF